EALTFADKVVVMHEGTVVQIGTPIELFEKPRHTFVGHFIGSPGMNILPCAIEGDQAILDGQRVSVQNPPATALDGKRIELGVRPEFVSFAADGLPVTVIKVSDAGRYRIVETRHGKSRINLLVDPAVDVPGYGARLHFDPAYTRLYADGWLVE
ncbi:MAG TPA: ABC transporter ATP-binding protein, partial [Vineibacter sp.]|nr:ABC transporter ATP-binding protein [Vineibacter sp.]